MMQNDDVLTRLLIEHWKLLRVCEGLVTKLHEQMARAEGHVRFSRMQLDSFQDDCGLKLVTFDGEKFDSHMAATSINADDFASDDATIVETTVEPAVVRETQVLHMGKVLLSKIETGEGEDDASGN